MWHVLSEFKEVFEEVNMHPIICISLVTVFCGEGQN